MASVISNSAEDHQQADKKNIINKKGFDNQLQINLNNNFENALNQNVRTVHGTRYLFNGFRFLGIYMPKKNRVFYVIWSFLINSAVTIYLPVGFILTLLTTSSNDLKFGDLLTTAQAGVNTVGSSVKFTLMGFLLPKLLSTENILNRLDERCKTTEELDSINKFIKDGNRFVVLFAITYWTYTTATCISSVISARLPYNLYNPFFVYHQSTELFILSILMEMILMNTVGFQQVVDDSYPIIYVNILRTHIDLLLKRIKRLGLARSMSHEETYEELKLCIIDHKNIIEVYNIVSSVISMTMFVQFTTTAIVLGTTLINILLFATNFLSTIASCFYVLAVIAEIFPLCYYAQYLIDESNLLADAMFHSNWMEQDLRYQKLLIFFTQRSQRVMDLSAGKLFPITLKSFLSVAKFSFSLYTLIKGMDVKERFGLN
uniref:Odorant receptor n=1 Tax=Glossina brevipalpis TaxID=37001 RepID=A0A1A9X570_9MUSC